MNKFYVFELFKKNAARKELRILLRIWWKNYEIFFMKIQQKTKQSKFQSTK